MWNQEGGALGGTKGGDQAPGAGAPSMSCRMVGPGGANLGLRGALVPRPGKEREGQRDQEGAGEGQMRGLRAAAGGAESTFHRFPGWVGQTQAPWPRGRNGDPRGHLENRGKPQCGTDTEGRGLSQSREGSPGPRGWGGSLLPAAWGPSVAPDVPLNPGHCWLPGPLTLIVLRTAAFCRDRNKPRDEQVPRTRPDPSLPAARTHPCDPGQGPWWPCDPTQR